MATKRKKRRIGRKIFLFFITLILIAVMTASICGVVLAVYLKNYADNLEPLNLATVDMDLTSTIYAIDADGNEVEYETLHGTENREWASISEIPLDLQHAFIAIEDQRFYEHKGVDWLRTGKAVFNWLTGDSGGGSTITQQLIKNVTQENSYSVKRKLTEIFRALKLEKDVGDKDVILEWYLNTIYLGQRSYGVKTAAMTYFGKELNELTLAECAVIAGITNAPTRYDPFRNPDNAKSRQELILDQMALQGWITEEEAEAAKAQPLEYKYEEAQAANNEPYTYFTDTVIRDVTQDLMAQKGWSEQYASIQVTSGGLKIYATIDLRIQQIMDEVYADDSNFPDVSKNGVRPESAMVICDREGNIKGIAGGRGEKTASLVLNRATQAVRQPGSSIKPLAVYGPAMDAGVITPYSVEINMPFKVIDGKAWPRNDSGGYTGQMVIKTAVAKSVNAIAVRVLDKLTPEKSYEFLTEKLGFKHLTISDMDYSPLALGGMSNGVTVREMAAGYTIFLNDGIFSGSRTYTKVLDANGNVLLDNTPQPIEAFENEKTAYYMRDVLKEVTRSGTATRARIDGIETAGKTGTSQRKRDLWFCGFTPYYVGATWFGYEKDYDLTGVSGNPSVTVWTKIMQRIHEGLPEASFDTGNSDNFVTASYCMDSGLSPTSACSSDIAGSRVATGRYWKGDQPQSECNLHKPFQICIDSGMAATEFCPAESVATISLMDLTRLFPISVSVADQYRCFTGENEPIGSGTLVSGSGDVSLYTTPCTLHTSATTVDPEDPEGGNTGDTSGEGGDTSGEGGSTSNPTDPGDTGEPEEPEEPTVTDPPLPPSDDPELN